jgi:hypothetical protein
MVSLGEGEAWSGSGSGGGGNVERRESERAGVSAHSGGLDFWKSKKPVAAKLPAVWSE